MPPDSIMKLSASWVRRKMASLWRGYSSLPDFMPSVKISLCPRLFRSFSLHFSLKKKNKKHIHCTSYSLYIVHPKLCMSHPQIGSGSFLNLQLALMMYICNNFFLRSDASRLTAISRIFHCTYFRCFVLSQNISDGICRFPALSIVMFLKSPTRSHLRRSHFKRLIHVSLSRHPVEMFTFLFCFLHFWKKKIERNCLFFFIFVTVYN